MKSSNIWFIRKAAKMPIQREEDPRDSGSGVGTEVSGQPMGALSSHTCLPPSVPRVFSGPQH